MKRKCALATIFLFLMAALCIGRSAQGDQAKPIELKIMHFASVTHVLQKDVFIPWAKMLEERTGGRVKVVIYPGELLGKVKDTYDATASGVADIGCAYFSATPNRFPLHTVFELPFMFSDAKVGSRVMWELFQKEESLTAEFRDVKVLWLFGTPSMQLHMVNKPVYTLADLSGKKVRTVGGVRATIVKTLGAVPVVIPTPDTYVALERGTVDGAVSTWEAMKAFKIDEVTKYHTVANLWSGVFYTVMNKKKWESLPPEIQKVIQDLSGAQAADQTATAFIKVDLEGMESVKSKGHEIINLAPAEYAKWRKSVMPLWDEWAKEWEAKGLPGKKILGEASSLIGKYSK